MASPIEVVVRMEPESKELLERLIGVLKELNDKTPNDKEIAKAIAAAMKFEEA